MKHDYSNLHEIIKRSLSYADVLRELNIKPAGGNYATLKQAVKKYNYDISHFTGKAWNQGLKYKPVLIAKPLEEVLVENKPTNTHNLRLRLIKNGIKSAQCEICNNELWNKKPIPLELDHIDGNRSNNLLSNLRIICPNCHAQTDTYRGKNIQKKKERIKKERILKYCIDCNIQIKSKSVRCKSCSGLQQTTKINWPLVEELEERLINSNYTKLAKELGVSDNAIRKRIKTHKGR